MSTLSEHSDLPEDYKVGNVSLMCFGNRRYHPMTVYSIWGILVALLFILTGYFGMEYRVAQTHPPEITTRNRPVVVPAFNETGPTAKLIQKLKKYGLWTLSPMQKVPRFFLKAYPPDLDTVRDISVKKRIFLHALLPQALLVRREVLQKRERLEAILDGIDCASEETDIDFGPAFEGQCSWTENLPEKDVSFIRNLSREYRTTSAETLLKRVDAVPVSIILAQGALESFWGSSRFSREGNSIFGMWTWKTPGIIPIRRDEGKTHKVKIYDDILASVRAYQLTLNRLEPYTEFRQLRQSTDDPLILAEGLSLYSERGQDYVEDIKKVILANNLQEYDNYSLNDRSLDEIAESFSNTAVDSLLPHKASL